MAEFDEYREDYDSLTEDDAREQTERLVAARNAHPEFAIHQAWTALWRSHDIFGGNLQELFALLIASETDPDLQTELFQNVRKPAVRDAFLRALDRTLHNALAGAVSLVDHTRRHVGEHFADSDFASEFEQRNGLVVALPEAAFLRRFRNYLLHVGHAPFTMSGTLGVKPGERSTLKIWLDSPALLAERGFWTGPARAFIEAHPEQIHLRGVVDRYAQAMQDLYRWVFDQQPVLSPKGLDILNEFTRRINLTMTLGSHDGRRMEEFWDHVAQNAKAFDEGRPQKDWRDAPPGPRD